MHKPKITLRVRFDFNQINENDNEILLYLCTKISSPAVRQKLKSHDSNVQLSLRNSYKFLSPGEKAMESKKEAN